uniref:RHS repeat domain-containing protein n=1 Tax=Acetivibrio cellulolyticus TaxID=35830 RepID=UPI001F1DA176|nr:RHS repeat domain-containing protein [Acetivibrio cellulolyticus]
MLYKKGPKGNFSYTYEMYDNGTIKKTTITDEKGNYVESQYDEKGNIDTISDFSNPSLKLVDNDYDTNGRLSQTKDGEGGTTILGYDSGNRIGTVTDQMNKKILQFHYDSVTGNLDTQTDALGVVTSFKEYDANGRWGKAEFTRTISEGITEIVSTSNIYDNMGRVTENTDGVGRVSKAYYNGIGKIGTYTDKYKNTLSYQYDCLGNLTQVDYPDKSSEKYTHEDEEFWAKDIYYGHESYWWVKEGNEQIQPKHLEG